LTCAAELTGPPNSKTKPSIAKKSLLLILSPLIFAVMKPPGCGFWNDGTTHEDGEWTVE
jgi:hypothetical protein